MPKPPTPAPLRERDITRHIAREYYKEFDQLIESDVIIVGAGPSGLICAHDLAEMGFKTVIVEQSLALGGGFWSGGYLMNKATICEPANEILEEIGVPCKKITECAGMYMVDPPHATGALIAAAYKGGAKIMNLTRVVDLIIRRDGILEGWWSTARRQKWPATTSSMWTRSPSKAKSWWMPQAMMPSSWSSCISGTSTRQSQATAPCGSHNRNRKSWTGPAKSIPTVS